MLSSRQGHSYGSQRVGATVFGPNWSDQQIVDAVMLTITDPHMYQYDDRFKRYRHVRRKVNGVTIKVSWEINPKGKAEFFAAYPVGGEDIMSVNSQNKMVPLPASVKDSSGFIPVPREQERRVEMYSQPVKPGDRLSDDYFPGYFQDEGYVILLDFHHTYGHHMVSDDRYDNIFESARFSYPDMSLALALALGAAIEHRVYLDDEFMDRVTEQIDWFFSEVIEMYLEARKSFTKPVS